VKRRFPRKINQKRRGPSGLHQPQRHGRGLALIWVLSVPSSGPQERPRFGREHAHQPGEVDARHSRVLVTRRTPAGVEKFTVNVGAILVAGELDKDIELAPGDTVYVPERVF
jgi:hypothetical protein